MDRLRNQHSKKDYPMDYHTKEERLLNNKYSHYHQALQCCSYYYKL